VLSLRVPLLDVFDAICETLRLVRAEQSTTAGL
jgi:hypothetical protein